MIGPHDASSSTEADTEAEQEQLEFQDEAVYSPPFGSKDVRTADVFSIDLYVAYSPVYRVPVLYFRGRKAGAPGAYRFDRTVKFFPDKHADTCLSLDGSLVPLECLMKSSFFYVGVSEYPLNTLNDGTDEPANTTEEREAAHFPAISQAEHPQTGLPCFYLHPCETSAALQDVLSNEQDNRFTPLQFIETWFMLISTLLDIR